MTRQLRLQGFSLVEMLVVISVVAVLIGLLLPVLGSVRERARATKSAANLHSIAVVMELYQNSYDDYFPVGSTGAFYAADLSGAQVEVALGNHFEFGRAWPLVVRDIAPWDEFAGSWLSPGRRWDIADGQDLSHAFSYVQSHALLASPDLWNPAGAPTGPAESLLAGVRRHTVMAPASKVSHWDADLAYLIDPMELMPGMLANKTPMLFVDGHVSGYSPGEAAAPVQNPLNNDPFTSVQPLHNTANGARGRDYP